MLVVYGGVADGRVGEWSSPRKTEQRTDLAKLSAPARAGDLAAHYDLTVSHPKIDEISFRFFDQWLAQAAAERGLSCLLFHDRIVDEVVRRLTAGPFGIGHPPHYLSP